MKQPSEKANALKVPVVAWLQRFAVRHGIRRVRKSRRPEIPIAFEGKFFSVTVGAAIRVISASPTFFAQMGILVTVLGRVPLLNVNIHVTTISQLRATLRSL